MSKAAELAALIGSQSALSNRNLIINGAMQVAQRGTSSTSSGNHTCDRWTVNFQAFDQLAVTQSQSTTTPSGFSNSLKVEVTTAETALAADELMYVSYRIEAQDLQQLGYGGSGAKAVTLSFWVRSSLTGKYSVLFYQDDATRSNTPSFTISTADTWEYKTITIDGDTGGTINNDNGAGLSLYITLAAGANFAGTPHSGWGAYTATDDFSFSDNVNFTAQTGTFYITGVQLEVGEQATPFEHRSYGDELAACQRYYQKSYIDGVAVGTVTQVGCNMDPVPTSGNTWRYTHNFTSHMRATPTYTFYVPDTGTSGFGGFEGAGDTNKEAIQVAFSSNKSGVYYSTSMDQTGFFMWHYELNAEL